MRIKNMNMTISELKHLKESEDKVEFKAATHNFSYAGSEHRDQEERRRCFLGYVVAFANEGGGRLILGMTDNEPHDVVGSDFADGKIGALEDETYRRLGIRVRMEELYENEEKLRLVVENISEGIIVVNSNKKIILANYMANEIFGIEEDDKITPDLSTYYELYFPDGITVFPSQNMPLERALKGEVSEDVEIILLNPEQNLKRRVLISGKPLIDQNDNVVAAVVTIKDISKYKQMEEDLKETELKYRQLIGYTKSNEKLK